MTESVLQPATISTARPHVKPRVAILSILGFWSFYFVINTLRMALSLSKNQLEMMGRRAVVVLAGIGLTVMLWRALRRVEGRSIRGLVATALTASIPAALAYATINYLVFYVVAPSEIVLLEKATYASDYKAALHLGLDSAMIWYFFITTWAVLYVALSYAERVGHA